MDTPETVLQYWFGSNSDDAVVAAEQANLWWSHSETVDGEIRERFESLVLQAGARELDEWASQPRSLLALILLTDQFPRNMYRGSARAFAFDPKALAWSLEGITAGGDLELRPIERVFFYLPFEHAESLAHQNRSVALFQKLVETVPVEQKSKFEGFLDFAVRHRAVIARFGRFPHRNKMLGRQSTAEESLFLTEPGSSF